MLLETIRHNRFFRRACACAAFGCLLACARRSAAQRFDGHALGTGLSIADPAGLTTKLFLTEAVALESIVGARVLGNETIEVPGPLITLDAVINPRIVGSDASSLLAGAFGVGFGAGWVRSGCYFDSVAEFCSNDVAPTVLARTELGLALFLAAPRIELGAQAGPGYRFTPDGHLTYLGGFAVRHYW